MTRCLFVISGDLHAPAGSYLYARKILPLLRERLSVELCQLPDGFPLPTKAALRQTEVALAALDQPGTVFLVDWLVCGALPRSRLDALRQPVVALAHHPLSLEEGLCASDKALLLKTEAEALAKASHIVTPSQGAAREFQDLFDLSGSKITVAEPGILRGARATGTSPGQPRHIVSVGSLTPRKGFGVLIDALSEVRDLPWTVTIAGSPDLSPETAGHIRSKISRYGLDDRVRLVGQLSEAAVSALYTSGDIFALASLYEGYGMAFAEAMAHGLPVVASGEGAVRDTVPEAAGILCPAGDALAFAEALRLILSNHALRRDKAEAAWQYGQTLPSWTQTADTIAGVLESMAG